MPTSTPARANCRVVAVSGGTVLASSEVQDDSAAHATTKHDTNSLRELIAILPWGVSIRRRSRSTVQAGCCAFNVQRSTTSTGVRESSSVGPRKQSPHTLIQATAGDFHTTEDAYDSSTAYVVAPRDGRCNRRWMLRRTLPHRGCVRTAAAGHRCLAEPGATGLARRRDDGDRDRDAVG